MLPSPASHFLHHQVQWPSLLPVVSGVCSRVEPVSLWESLETTAVYQEGFPEMWSLDGEGELYRFMAFGVCFCSPNWKHMGSPLQPTWPWTALHLHGPGCLSQTYTP